MGLCCGKRKAIASSRTSYLDQNDLKALEKESHFTQAELEDWYKTFLNSYPGGIVTRDEFKDVYKLTFPDNDVDAFSDYIFQAFDNNRDGVLNYKEFIVGLSLTTKCDLDEKLHWAFNFYDEDQSGFISRNELYDVFNAFDKISTDVKKTVTLDERVDAVFKLLDKNCDDKITIDEFVEGVKKDKTMKRVTETTLSMTMT